MYQRRIARERELHPEAFKCKEIMELIKTAGFLKTVTQIGRCYDWLVKEFIVNVGPEVGLKGHDDFCKVFVRGSYVQFSPAEIKNIWEEQMSLQKKKKFLWMRL